MTTPKKPSWYRTRPENRSSMVQFLARQISFTGLMIVIVAVFPLPPLAIVSNTFILKSSHYLGKTNVQSTGKRNPSKAWKVSPYAHIQENCI